MNKKAVFIGVLTCCCSCFAFGQPQAASSGREEAPADVSAYAVPQNGLHGTLWKMVSWATDDEYVGFYDGRIYYVLEGGYSSVDLLSDSFYRDYDLFSIGSAVIPEALINYPGDVVVWGLFLHSPAIGFGYALPLPVPALLLLHAIDWQPDRDEQLLLGAAATSPLTAAR